MGFHLPMTPIWNLTVFWQDKTCMQKIWPKLPLRIISPGGVVETAFWAAENGFEDKTSKGRVLEHKKGQNVENSHQEDQVPHGLRFDPPKGGVEPLTLKLSFQKRQVPHELRFDLPRGGGVDPSNLDFSVQEHQVPYGLQFGPPKGGVDTLNVEFPCGGEQSPKTAPLDGPKGGGCQLVWARTLHVTKICQKKMRKNFAKSPLSWHV